MERLATRQAAPCILAAVRRAWLLRAHARQDVDGLLDALAWSTWSWIGRPLLAHEFIELEAPAYPHLMDLRSVASNEWYYNRRKGVPALLQSRYARAGRAGGGQFPSLPLRRRRHGEELLPALRVRPVRPSRRRDRRVVSRRRAEFEMERGREPRPAGGARHGPGQAGREGRRTAACRRRPTEKLPARDPEAAQQAAACRSAS